MITLDAGQLARGWLAVAQATGKNKDQPALWQTIHCDQYHDGLRLVATDSYMILHCWIPSVYEQSAPEPVLLGEAPYASATVIDRHGRALSLLGYLLSLSKQDDHKGIEVNVSLNVPWQPEDSDAKDLQIDGFEALAVTLEVPDRERLQLEVYEGTWVGWQHIVSRHRNTRTSVLALSPLVAGRLAKAARVYDDTPLRLWFGGHDKPIQVAFGNDPEVTGLLMSSRWDFSRDQPYDTDGEDDQ